MASLPFAPERLPLAVSRPLQAALLILAFLCAGAVVPMLPPALIVLLAGVVVVPAVLLMRDDQLVAVSLGLLFLARPLVALGAPSILNFAHYGMALFAFCRLLQSSQTSSRVLSGGLLAFLALAYVSAIVNHGWHPLRPGLVWLTYCEPFIFVGLVSLLDSDAKNRLKQVAIALVLVQIPFIAVQFAQNGVSDFVKGTLIHQGAGHHIVGAVGLVGGLLVLFAFTDRRVTALRVLLAVVMIALGFFADAKQVYAAFAVAMVLVGMTHFRRSMAPALLPVALFAVILLVAARIDSTFAELTDKTQITWMADAKISQSEEIIGRSGPAEVPFGYGPGLGMSKISVSTIARFTRDGFGHVPALLLGEQYSELALHELSSYDTVRTSSTASPFSSWLGLYTDLGVFGLALYVALGAWVWLGLGSASDRQKSLGRDLLGFACLLGFIFFWLEEPVFTVYVAVVIGALFGSGIATSQQETPEKAGIESMKRPLRARIGSVL